MTTERVHMAMIDWKYTPEITAENQVNLKN